MAYPGIEGDLSQCVDRTAGTRSLSHVRVPANILLGSRGQELSGHQAADSSDLFLISLLVAQIVLLVFFIYLFIFSIGGARRT